VWSDWVSTRVATADTGDVAAPKAAAPQSAASAARPAQSRGRPGLFRLKGDFGMAPFPQNFVNAWTLYKRF
jgi:hypothetical protein